MDKKVLLGIVALAGLLIVHLLFGLQNVYSNLDSSLSEVHKQDQDAFFLHRLK